MVCILLLLAVGITASAVGLNSTVESAAGGQAPYDLTVYNGAPEEGPADLDQLLRDQLVDPAQVFAWEYEAVVYYNDPAVTGEEAAWAALPLSVYNALLDRLGRPAYAGPLPYVPENWSADPAFGYMGNFLVVDDGTAGALEPCWQIWFLDYAGDKEAAEGQVLDALNGPDTQFPYGYTSRLETWQTLMGSKILVLFLGLYLGFTFLLAAAAVLALQQLSQGADNAGRYAVLRRLGAEEELTARSAGQQVALAFLAPLALALIHSAVGMKAANDLIATAAGWTAPRAAPPPPWCCSWSTAAISWPPPWPAGGWPEADEKQGPPRFIGGPCLPPAASGDSCPARSGSSRGDRGSGRNWWGYSSDCALCNAGRNAGRSDKRVPNCRCAAS